MLEKSGEERRWECVAEVESRCDFFPISYTDKNCGIGLEMVEMI